MIVKFKDWKVINNEDFMTLIMSIKDGEYVFEKYKKTRTNDQNRYLRWCVYKTIAKAMWEEDENYIHWVMWMKFLVDRTKKAEYIKSTANLSTQEFMEYIENIKNFVAQYWIIIPEADEFWDYWTV